MRAAAVDQSPDAAATTPKWRASSGMMSGPCANAEPATFISTHDGTSRAQRSQSGGAAGAAAPGAAVGAAAEGGASSSAFVASPRNSPIDDVGVRAQQRRRTGWMLRLIGSVVCHSPVSLDRPDRTCRNQTYAPQDLSPNSHSDVTGERFTFRFFSAYLAVSG